jgi:hypothetical protein
MLSNFWRGSRIFCLRSVQTDSGGHQLPCQRLRKAGVYTPRRRPKSTVGRSSTESLLVLGTRWHFVLRLREASLSSLIWPITIIFLCIKWFPLLCPTHNVFVSSDTVRQCIVSEDKRIWKETVSYSHCRLHTFCFVMNVTIISVTISTE